METISFLGTGWLGVPCAKKFLEDSFSVSVSTRSSERFSLLKESFLSVFNIDIYDSQTFDHCSDFWKSSVLVITVPFHRSLSDPWVYPEAFQKILNHCSNNAIEHILFTSSTSVYQDIPAIVEENDPIGFTDRAKALHQAERILLSQDRIKTTVLRLGGLVGPQRHPGSFFQKKSLIQNPQTPVNLVHLHDVISVIYRVIKKNFWGYIFNVVSDYHESRKTFYTQSAQSLGLPIPLFENDEGHGKIVSNDYLKKTLSFQFQWNGEIF